MTERTRLVLLVLAVVVAGLLAWNSLRWMKRQLEIDACLDFGGCWDEAHGRCSNIQADWRGGADPARGPGTGP